MIQPPHPPRATVRPTALVALAALVVVALLATATATAGFDVASVDRPVVAATAPDGAAHLGVSASVVGDDVSVTVVDRAGLGVTDVRVDLDDGRTVALAPVGPRRWAGTLPRCETGATPASVVVRATGPDVAATVERPLPGGPCVTSASTTADGGNATTDDAVPAPVDPAT